MGVGGLRGDVTGVLVASLTISGGRQRSLVPDFIEDLEASQDEAAVLLVETKAAERL